MAKQQISSENMALNEIQVCNITMYGNEKDVFEGDSSEVRGFLITVTEDQGFMECFISMVFDIVKMKTKWEEFS